MKKILSVFLALVMMTSAIACTGLSATAAEYALLRISSDIAEGAESPDLTYVITVDDTLYDGTAVGEKSEYEVKDGILTIPADEYAMIDLPFGAKYSVYRTAIGDEKYCTVAQTEEISGIAGGFVYTETTGNVSIDIGDEPIESPGTTREITEEEYNTATNNGENETVTFYRPSRNDEVTARVTADKVEACYPVAANTSSVYCLKDEQKKTLYASVEVTSSCKHNEPLTSYGKATYTFSGDVKVTINGKLYTQSYVSLPSQTPVSAKDSATTNATVALRAAMLKATNENFTAEDKSAASLVNLSTVITPSVFSETDGQSIVLRRSVALVEFTPYIPITCTYQKTENDSICNVTFSGEGINSHSYGDWIASETDSTHSRTCSLCNNVITEDHIWDEGDIAKEPTCATEGETVFHCIVCLATRTEPIACTDNHTYTTTKATVSKNGAVKCSNCGTVKSTIYYPKTITLSATKYTYDGKVKKPTVKVVGSNGKAISASNYTVTYASGRKNVGKYAVKVTFKGNYSGSKILYFNINPKGTTLSSVSAGSKSFTAKWKKQATQTTGYQIQYATDSKFTKGVKTVTVKKNSTTSTKVAKLTGKKKYYVRIRTYKTVNKVNYYSAWSSAKAVTTKK